MNAGSLMSGEKVWEERTANAKRGQRQKGAHKKDRNKRVKEHRGKRKLMQNESNSVNKRTNENFW